MKKIKAFNIFLILIMALFVSFSFLPKTSKAFAEEEDSQTLVTIIDNLSQITNASGSYKLKGDCDFGSLSISFKGSLDGNGHTLTVSQNSVDYEGELKPLFASLQGATITNLCIKNVTLNLDKSGAYSGENIGIIAGQATNSTLDNIKIDDCKIIKSNLLADTNIGFLCGKMTTNCVVKNVIVQNCFYSLGIGETISTKFNFGGLVGQAEDIIISNSIVNLYNLSDTLKNVTITSTSEKDIYFGGLIGEFLPSTYRLYNNVAIMFNSNFTLQSLLNFNCGAMIGKIGYISNEPFIKGFLTTYSNNIFGVSSNNDYTLQKVQIVDYDALSINYFTNEDNWNNIAGYKWDFERTWVSVSGQKLPDLQVLSAFSATFSPSESDGTLDVEILPTNPVIYGLISNQASSTGLVSDASTLNSIVRDSSIFICVKISDDYYYNKFFKITGLKLNGNTIYDNETEIAGAGFTINFEVLGNVLVYKIQNFNANMAGEYTVSLTTIPYYIDVLVYNLGTNEEPILPGGVKSNTNSNLLATSRITMEYGDRVALTSVASNKDYSDVTYWYLFNNNTYDSHNEKIDFNLVLAKENYFNNRISWEFTENCELFENNNGATEYNLSLFNGETDPEYQFIVLFEKSVKEIEIQLKFDNEDIINKKVCAISIDGKTDRISWDEEKKCFVAKISYSQETEHQIKIISYQTEYEFDSWRYELGKLVSGEDEFTGIFEIPESVQEDTDTETMKIFCVFKTNKQDFGSELLWLWITLGAVGLIGVIVVVILIRRRLGGGGRTGGGSNTKRYYY